VSARQSTPGVGGLGAGGRCSVLAVVPEHVWQLVLESEAHKGTTAGSISMGCAIALQDMQANTTVLLVVVAPPHTQVP
jgi:hypothetical protein